MTQPLQLPVPARSRWPFLAVIALLAVTIAVVGVVLLVLAHRVRIAQQLAASNAANAQKLAAQVKELGGVPALTSPEWEQVCPPATPAAEAPASTPPASTSPAPAAAPTVPGPGDRTGPTGLRSRPAP
jgi:type II secretory pathway pseudopilin PulG